MPFEQYAEYDPSLLPLSTRFRFAEIEINKAISQLTKLFTHDESTTALQKARNTIMDILFTPMEKYTHEARFLDVTLTMYFRNPISYENINYMLYHHQSYKTIQKLIKVSPNTIAGHRFQPIPNYPPIFDDWTENMLRRWNHAKQALNIWNESLVHSEK
jgi:hypothetical protein